MCGRKICCVALVLLTLVIGSYSSRSGEVGPTNKIAVSGQFLAAWNVVFEDLKKAEQLDSSSRQPENFNVTFFERGDTYVVYMAPQAPRNGSTKYLLGGGDIEYHINKNNYKISARRFYK